VKCLAIHQCPWQRFRQNSQSGLLPAEDALSPTDMNGYLAFLKGLSEYQQRAQIAHLVFRERWGGFSMEEDILKVQPVSTFTESLGVGACS
jgi:hypothetical protein